MLMTRWESADSGTWIPRSGGKKFGAEIVMPTVEEFFFS